MRTPAKIIVSLLSLILAGALLMTVPATATELRSIQVGEGWSYDLQYIYADNYTERSAYWQSVYDHSYDNSLALRVYKCISESPTYNGPMQFSNGFTLNSGNVIYTYLHFSTSGGGSIDASVTQNGSRQPIETDDVLYFSRSTDITNQAFLRCFEKQDVYPNKAIILGTFDGIGDLPPEYYSAFHWYCHAEVYASITNDGNGFNNFYFEEPDQDNDSGFQMSAVHPASESEWQHDLLNLDPNNFNIWKYACWIIDFEFDFAEGYAWRLSSPILSNILDNNHIVYYVTNCYLTYDYDPDVITHDQMQQIIDAIDAPLDPGSAAVSGQVSDDIDNFNDIHDQEQQFITEWTDIADQGYIEDITDRLESGLLAYGAGLRVWTNIYNEIWESNSWIKFIFRAALTTSVFLSILGFSSSIGRSIHRDSVSHQKQESFQRKLTLEAHRQRMKENHSDKGSMMNHYRGDD